MTDWVSGLRCLSSWMLQQDVDMQCPPECPDPADAADEIERLTARVAELEGFKNFIMGKTDNLVMQARIHACESDTQSATVNEIYQVCTGSTGEPGNWHGAEPVRKALKEAREKALREAAQVASTRGLDYVVGHSGVEIDEDTANDIAKRITALLDKEEG